MRWLLISSYDNPGDTFIRMGVEQLVKHIDPSPHFNTLYKEMREQWDTLELLRPDKIIWCGMPFLWSFPTHSSLTIFWREPFLKKLYQRKNDFLILGAGTAGLCAEKASDAFTRIDDIHCSLDEALNNSFSFTMRDDCLSLYDIRKDITTLPCPAIFANEQATPEHNNLVCNFMLNGGHYPELSKETSDAWNKQLMRFATELREQQATFAAHSEAESSLAQLHGFTSTYSGHHHLLGQLSGAKRYIGNRIHGAIVAASSGADSTCIGFDLRLRAAALAGAKTTYFNCPTLPPLMPIDKSSALSSYLSILRKFIQ